MSRKKVKVADSLLVVAHPDDDALFFSGLLLTKKFRWKVVCVTDGNADGQGDFRTDQFHRACKAMGALDWEKWDFPDIFDKRLDINSLTERLKNLGTFKRVFTHGVLGEYGHYHHQDVSLATHRAFGDSIPVYSASYNTYPDLRINLSASNFKIKTKILWEIYGSETKRLLHFLPATSSEGFVRIPIKEVEALHAWLSGNAPLNTQIIKIHKWLIPYLEQGGGHLTHRPF